MPSHACLGGKVSFQAVDRCKQQQMYNVIKLQNQIFCLTLYNSS